MSDLERLKVLAEALAELGGAPIECRIVYDTGTREFRVEHHSEIMSKGGHGAPVLSLAEEAVTEQIEKYSKELEKKRNRVHASMERLRAVRFRMQEAGK